MPFFQWEARYDLGVEPMNAEHHVLIDRMNKLYDLHAAKADRRDIARAIDHLEAYTVTHFTHEEQYQASIRYPGLEAHKRVHQDLLAQFGQHKQAFLKGAGTLSPEFFVFLKAWLGAHIAGIDRKYATHAQSLKTGAV